LGRFVVEGNVQETTNNRQVLHGLDLLAHFSLLGVLEVDVLAGGDGDEDEGKEEGEELTAEVDDHEQGASNHSSTDGLSEEGSFLDSELEAGDVLGDLELLKDPGELAGHDLLGGASGLLNLHGTSGAEDGNEGDDGESSKERHFFFFR